MTQTIEQLQARVAELSSIADDATRRAEAEMVLKNDAQARVAELEAENAKVTDQKNCMWFELATAQADSKRLRDALRGLSFGEDWNNGTHAKIYRPQLLKLLAQPSDTSALGAYVAEKVKAISDILSEKMNEWALKRDELTRQRDLAVEALQRIAKVSSSPMSRTYAEDTLSTIKESEGM